MSAKFTSDAPQPVLTFHNETHFLNKGSSPPDNTTTLPPTASTSPSVPFPTFPRFVAVLVEKQYSNFMLMKFPNNITTTTTIADDSQQPNFSDDKPSRDLDAATTTTDSIIFDKKPNQKLNDDDDLEIEYRQFAQSVDTFDKKFCCQKVLEKNGSGAKFEATLVFFIYFYLI